MSEATDEDLMRAAFAALLKGDTATRDKLCDVVRGRMMARIQVAEREPPKPVDLEKLPDGTYAPVGMYRRN